MTQQILNEIEVMKANNLGVNEMTELLCSKFDISKEIAKEWISIAALANGFGIELSELA